MSFDTFTIVGILSALASGGFLVALVACNDTYGRNRCGMDNGDRPAES